MNTAAWQHLEVKFSVLDLEFKMGKLTQAEFAKFKDVDKLEKDYFKNKV